MIDLEPTLLTLNRLKSLPRNIFKTAPATDLALICGAGSPGADHPHIKPITNWWLRTYYHSFDWEKNLFYVYSVVDDGCIFFAPSETTEGGCARPALPPESTSLIIKNKAYSLREEKDFWVASYGEYPQFIASDHEHSQLNQAYMQGNLHETDKKYTVVSLRHDFLDCAEYEYNGNRYIRIKNDCHESWFIPHTNDGRILEHDKHYWVRVSPIEWLTDPSGWWLMKYCPVGPMPYNIGGSATLCAWGTIGRFLLNKFAKQIQPLGR